MEAIGEELYGIIHQCYPELAPKLTGMILALGEEECLACLDDQEKLAARLDQAFELLDASGQCAKEPEPEEKRIDPEDGKARTFTQLRSLCAARYSMQEIEEYWRTMEPVGGGSAPGAAKPKATAKASAAPAVAAAKTSSSAVRKPAAAPVSTPQPPPAAAPRASPAADIPAPAAVAPVEEDGPLPGLDCWLHELKLDGYAVAAAQWVEEQGACTLEEIVENLEDFAQSLNLKKLEQKRLMQNGEAAAKVAMEASANAPPPAAKAKTPEASPYSAELEEAQREKEELEREMEEIRELERNAGRGRGSAGAKASPAKAKAPSVRVVPKATASAPSREELEWKRETEKQEREFEKRQKAKQAAAEAEAAAQAAEEKRQARAREAEERQQRAAAEIAAKMAASGAPETGEPADDFPALSGDWQASGRKKGKKRV